MTECSVFVPDKSGSRRSKKEVKTLGTFWKDKFMGGRHLQRVVDVGRLHTLNRCRKCAGWAQRTDWSNISGMSVNLETKLAYRLRIRVQGYQLGRRMEIEEQNVE